jgi:Xaa-Pro dipeptidase
MIDRIREAMKKEGIDCLILTEEANFTWALEKRISGYLFITQGRLELVAPRFYRYQTQEMDAEYAFSGEEYEEILEEKAEKFVGDVKADTESEKLQEMFDATETDLVQELRKHKTDGEIDKIREACRITDEALLEIREQLFSGIDEFEAVAEINSFYAEKGVEEAFLTNGGQSLVQANCLEPHRPPEKRRIRPGDLVIVDSGCRYENYCSDVTRTYCEDPDEEQRQLFEDVKKIQKEVIDLIEPGRSISELKQKEIELAEELGYEPEKHILYFSHCIGVEAHEQPTITHTTEGELEEGMVLTVEPGLHVPEIGGVRLEDTVAVTGEGYEVLSNAPKEL